MRASRLRQIQTLYRAPATAAGLHRAVLRHRRGRAARLRRSRRLCGAAGRAAGMTRQLRRCSCLRCARGPRRLRGLPPRLAAWLRLTGRCPGSAIRTTRSRSRGLTLLQRLARRSALAALPPRRASARRWRRAWRRRRGGCGVCRSKPKQSWMSCERSPPSSATRDRSSRSSSRSSSHARYRRRQHAAAGPAHLPVYLHQQRCSPHWRLRNASRQRCAAAGCRKQSRRRGSGRGLRRRRR